MQSNVVWVAVGVVVAALLAGSLFWASHRGAPTPMATSSASSEASSTIINLGNGNSITVPQGATVHIINPSLQPPSLSGSIQISSNLPSDAQATLRTQEQTLISQLRQFPTRVDLWLELGVDRKIAGDYQGAVDAWTFVAKAGDSTINYIAYGDLGDLYMNFLHDYPKAEANYKAAIAINPHVIDYYASLYTMYKSFYKQNTSAAADILAAGLKANPGNQELLALQQGQ